jgi:hypothetical protein
MKFDKKFQYNTNHNWFKGNTHIHSTASDGRRSIHEIAELYAKAINSTLNVPPSNSYA